jgi:hypothetical protein
MPSAKPSRPVSSFQIFPFSEYIFLERLTLCRDTTRQQRFDDFPFERWGAWFVGFVVGCFWPCFLDGSDIKGLCMRLHYGRCLYSTAFGERGVMHWLLLVKGKNDVI